jgi:hypothetical protein
MLTNGGLEAEKWSPGGPTDQWSQIPITMKRSWIWIPDPDPHYGNADPKLWLKACAFESMRFDFNTRGVKARALALGGVHCIF